MNLETIPARNPAVSLSSVPPFRFSFRSAPSSKISSPFPNYALEKFYASPSIFPSINFNLNHLIFRFEQIISISPAETKLIIWNNFIYARYIIITDVTASLFVARVINNREVRDRRKKKKKKRKRRRKRRKKKV